MDSPMAQSPHHRLIAIICDACGDPKPHIDVCIDMEGCSHLPCFECLGRDQNGGGGGGGLVRCPVPGCLVGFLNQLQTWVEEGLDAAATEEEQEEQQGQHQREITFFCAICMETKPLQDGFFGAVGCSHVFCSVCIAGYVDARVDENLVPIACPEPGCRAGRLEPEECRGVVRQAVFDRWGMLLCESAVAAPVRFYCPYSDCSALLANEGDEEGRPMTESQCLHCNRTCCAQCRVAPWHQGKSCEEYRREKAEVEEVAKLMELAKVRQWQKCPNCGAMVERIDGCVFIRCRCKHCFCYKCATAMDAGDRRHFCASCGLTWDNK